MAEAQPTSISITPGKKVVRATLRYPAKSGQPKAEMKIIIECDDPEDAALYLGASQNHSKNQTPDRSVEIEVTSGMEEVNSPS